MSKVRSNGPYHPQAPTSTKFDQIQPGPCTVARLDINNTLSNTISDLRVFIVWVFNLLGFRHSVLYSLPQLYFILWDDIRTALFVSRVE